MTKHLLDISALGTTMTIDVTGHIDSQLGIQIGKKLDLEIPAGLPTVRDIVNYNGENRVDIANSGLTQLINGLHLKLSFLPNCQMYSAELVGGGYVNRRLPGVQSPGDDRYRLPLTGVEVAIPKEVEIISFKPYQTE